MSREVVVAVAMLAALAGCTRSSTAPTMTTPSATTSAPDSPRAILPDGAVVSVEIAADDATREQGLMYRDQLANDRGMLFIFSHAGLYPFWMKNTLIPLDMIWASKDGRVVHVESNVPPCKADPCRSYGPGDGEASYVLETAAGVAARHGVKDGATLRFQGVEHAIVH